MDATALLATLKDLGVSVSVRGDKLRLEPGSRVPLELVPEIRAQKPALLRLVLPGAPRQVVESLGQVEERSEAVDAEVAWRIEAMRPQVPRTGGIPFLVARRVPVEPGCCHSCGDPKPPGHFVRCGPCIQAATLVLDEVREGVAPWRDPTR